MIEPSFFISRLVRATETPESEPASRLNNYLGSRTEVFPRIRIAAWSFGIPRVERQCHENKHDTFDSSPFSVFRLTVACTEPHERSSLAGRLQQFLAGVVQP